jgi:hypothetical protein
VNLYAFVGNDPVNRFDANGLAPQKVVDERLLWNSIKYEFRAQYANSRILHENNYLGRFDFLRDLSDVPIAAIWDRMVDGTQTWEHDPKKVGDIVSEMFSTRKEELAHEGYTFRDNRTIEQYRDEWAWADNARHAYFSRFGSVERRSFSGSTDPDIARVYELVDAVSKTKPPEYAESFRVAMLGTFWQRVGGAYGVFENAAGAYAAGTSQRPEVVTEIKIGSYIAQVPVRSLDTGSPIVNPRLTQRLQAWRDYRANGGTTEKLKDWVRQTQGVDWGTGFDSNYAGWIRSIESVHGNSLLSDRTAYLYRLEDAKGNLLKWGITQDLDERYSGIFLLDKKLIPVAQGRRVDMLRMERDLVETNPGPWNYEPWAGSRVGVR